MRNPQTMLRRQGINFLDDHSIDISKENKVSEMDLKELPQIEV